MAVFSTPAQSLLQSGQQNEIPQTTNYATATITFDPGPDFCLENRFLPIATPSYHALDVRGNSSLYMQQVANYGLVNLKILTARLSGAAAPAYAHVICDGVEYVIQVGQVVQVPGCVFNNIQNSSGLSAILV